MHRHCDTRHTLPYRLSDTCPHGTLLLQSTNQNITQPIVTHRITSTHQHKTLHSSTAQNDVPCRTILSRACSPQPRTARSDKTLPVVSQLNTRLSPPNLISPRRVVSLHAESRLIPSVPHRSDRPNRDATDRADHTDNPKRSTSQFWPRRLIAIPFDKTVHVSFWPNLIDVPVHVRLRPDHIEPYRLLHSALFLPKLH